jgi:hypothetical protein
MNPTHTLLAVLLLTQTVATAADTTPAITLVSPLDYQVVQRRTVREGVVVVAGQCAGACDRVEARMEGKDFEQRDLPTDWTNVPWQGDVRNFRVELKTPAGGWYRLDLRAIKDGKPVASLMVPHVGVGEVFVGAGQSNSTSCGGLGSKSPLDGRTQPVSGLVTTFNGNSWRIADDPQPGAHDEKDYALGSFWPAFGDAMADRFKVPVGVAVTGHGGTSIKSWKTDGELFNWTLTRMRQLGPNGFRAVLWHQGESDRNMPAQEYADGLGAIIRDFRKQAGWEMPWFVARASFAPNQPLNEAGSRGGQKMLWENKTALEGPDTDTMLGDLRDNDGTGIHFSKKGLKFHGEAWAAKVGAWMDGELAKQRQSEKP